MRLLGRLALLPGLVVAGSVAAAPDPFEATRSRPLFSSTRRPLPPPAVVAVPVAPEPAAPPPAPPPPPPSLALSGVILGPGTTGIALLMRPGSPQAMRVALGGQVDGWRVAEIRPRAVVLTLADRSVTVTLPDAGSAPKPPPPSPDL